MAVGHHHRKCIAAHHVLVGPGTAGGENVLQRNAPQRGEITQRQAFGRAPRNDVEKLTEGQESVDRQLGLMQQAVDLVELRRFAWVDVKADLETALLALGLQPYAGQLGQRAAHRFGVPVVIDVPAPGAVGGELRCVEDFGADAGNEYVRHGNAEAFHDAQCRLQAAAGGDAETDALAVFAHHRNEIGQAVRVAEQVLIQVGEQGTIVVQHRPANQRCARQRFNAFQQRCYGFQVAARVCLPRVVLVHALQPVCGTALPEGCVGQQLQQRLGDSVLVQRVDQQPVVAGGEDILRATVLGGYHRQAAGGRLQESESEGFCQGRIDKHPARCCRQPVDYRHLVG